MKLAIISHTEHYKNAEGQIVGWGPTVTEINHLISKFEKIYHVAFFHEEEPPPSSIPYQSAAIEFVPLPVSGGRTLAKKLNVITQMPETIHIVKEVLAEVDAFQLRTPVGIGVYLIPWLNHFSNKKGWFKYAGNWNQENPPLGYALQRKMLKNQSRKVTINGKWEDQPSHCLTFENPCLTLLEREEGTKIVEEKNYSPKFSFCFVGRLEDEKGVQRILDAFSAIENIHAYVENIHLVGNGKKRSDYEAQVAQKDLPVTFHGFLNRKEVFNLYRQCHFLLLPSTASEGFPKVIAEAMNYGCLPIVSSVSSIGQYINNENGYIINPTTSEKLQEIIKGLFTEEASSFQKKARKAYYTSESFTFENYNRRIWYEILEQE